MAIRYKNPQTGEYEVIKIPVMKGEQGHAGIHVGTDAPPTTDVKLWFDPSDTDNDVDLANRLDTTLTACYDYMGNDRGSIKAAADANVDWLLGEINTVHYDGQYITATDTIEGHSKSAILSGQTLVNIHKLITPRLGAADNDWYGNLTRASGEISFDVLSTPTGWRYIDAGFLNFKMLKPNTKYLVVFESSQNLSSIGFKCGDGLSGIAQGVSVENNKAIITTDSQIVVNEQILYVNFYAEPNTKVSFKNPMIIEYQEGMENWDIPYFEGIQSVQMPVLTTTGKNLFNDGGIDKTPLTSTHPYSERLLAPKLKAGVSYISNGYLKDGTRMTSMEYSLRFLNINRTLVVAFFGVGGSFNLTQEQLNEIHYVDVITNNAQGQTIQYLQIEEGSTATPYEPYQSNILTVNEEVTLRGIGNVKDELNVATGEKVERIGEIVADGVNFKFVRSQVNNEYKDGSVRFDFQNLNDIFVKSPNNWGDSREVVNNDRLKTGFFGTFSSAKEKDVLAIWDNVLVVVFSDTNIKTVGQANEWLKQNPITIQYKLAEPVIKRVDLSDNHVYSYKGVTHYDCSSAEGSLVPTLSIDVPTNLPALVTKQRQQIRTLEEENQILSDELQLAITSSEENDNELLAQSFELDFRLMEVECALDLPMAATFRLGGKAMAMTPYEMAKKLILADNYDRADMEHKLDVYVSKKRMTEAERQELIQLMDEKEGVITIDPVEPEVEESVIEHEAVTIPLH